jgi:hypothetical protein
MISNMLRIFTVELIILSQLSERGWSQDSSEFRKAKNLTVSAAKSILYGPALNPRISTPARYLFIQAVTEQGNNFTRSAGANAFDVQILITHEGRHSKLRSEVRDRGDGTYQVFFFFGIQPDSLIISVKTTDGQFVGGHGPVVVQDVEVEQCYCPRKAKRWTADYNCPGREIQLDRDLSIFPTIDQELLNRTFETLVNKEACFVHYVIRRNRIYGKAYGRFFAFASNSKLYPHVPVDIWSSEG